MRNVESAPVDGDVRKLLFSYTFASLCYLYLQESLIIFPSSFCFSIIIFKNQCSLSEHGAAATAIFTPPPPPLRINKWDNLITKFYIIARVLFLFKNC